MRVLTLLVLWSLLWIFAWPLALLVLVAMPIVLLVAIPFGIIGLVLSAIWALAEALLMAPARMLGYRSRC